MARNIVHMALPMTVAQLINILYNVVDRMYLGRLPGHLADGAGPVPAHHLHSHGLCQPVRHGGRAPVLIHRGKGENEEAERI